MICKTLKKIVGEKTNFLKRWRSFLLRVLALFERSEFAKLLQKARQRFDRKSCFCDLFSEWLANQE
jgi:hypothetical protein